jgi:hypothetical protein
MYYGGYWGGYPYYWGQFQVQNQPQPINNVFIFKETTPDAKPYVINKNKELVPVKEAFPDTPDDQFPTYSQMQEASKGERKMPREIIAAQPDDYSSKQPRAQSREYRDPRRENRYRDDARVVIEDVERDARDLRNDVIEVA